MSRTRHLSASQAAARLGVSVKALRLYEQRGLLFPARTAAGWRAYGPTQMARAAEIAGLRALGLSLAQVGRVLGGDAHDLASALAGHQSALEGRRRDLSDTIARVHRLRDDLARGQQPGSADLAGPSETETSTVSFDLPWPWGGERFRLGAIRPLTYITGPLGCGKTRFAMRLAEELPDAAFLDLERAGKIAAVRARLAGDPALGARVGQTLRWLIEDGATSSDALLALVASLEADRPSALVIDMVEEGLDRATQEALIARLRTRIPGARPLFMMTRSTAILDLAAVGPDETILLCPANHSPPIRVAAYPGSAGYEAVATCLASPDVRARTAGVIAWRPTAP